MKEQINIIQGIIFPDIIDTLIKCGIVKSNADYNLKMLQEFDPTLTGDKLIFRDVRKLEDSFKDKSKIMSPREIRVIIRKSLKVIKNILPSECKLKIVLSDYRAMGNWFGYKAFLSEYQSDISDYVLELCQKEKQCLLIIRKTSDDIVHRREIIKLIRKTFHISDILLYKIEKLTNLEKNKDIINQFNASLRIHQFLHLISIVEHDLYGDDKHTYNAVNHLLPYVNNKGKHMHSVNNLVIATYKKLGFKSQYKFVEYLSNEDAKEERKIKKQLNGWKTGKNVFTPKKFNELINKRKDKVTIDDELPAPLILISIILDQIYKDSLDMGMTQEWIINELNQYKRYMNSLTHN